MSTLQLEDGGEYNGEVKDEKPQGQGTCVWPGGATYTGEWRAGVMHGKGWIWLPPTRLQVPHTSSLDLRVFFIERMGGRGDEGIG
jgi:hypothetical protein